MLNNVIFTMAPFGNTLLLTNMAIAAGHDYLHLDPLLWLGLQGCFPMSHMCLIFLHFNLDCSPEIKTKLDVQLPSRKKMCYNRNCIICSKDKDDLWIMCYLGFWMLLVSSLPAIIEGRFHLFYLTFPSLAIFKKHLMCPWPQLHLGF